MHGHSLLVVYRVLTIHGTLDEMVPVEDAAEFAKHILNHCLRIIVGADHEFTRHQSELGSIVLRFVSTGKNEVSSDSCSSCCRNKLFIDSRI